MAYISIALDAHPISTDWQYLYPSATVRAGPFSHMGSVLSGTCIKASAIYVHVIVRVVGLIITF